MVRTFPGPGHSAEDIRVLVASDSELARDVFTFSLLRSAGLEPVASTDINSGLAESARTLQPDVILLVCPGTGATSSIAEVARAGLAARLVLVSTGFDPRITGNLVQAGVVGIVLESQGWRGLEDTIRVVHSGGFCVPQSIAGSALGVKPAREGSLNARDIQLLDLVARGLTNSEIASRMNVSESTVRSRLSELLLKLNVSNRMQAVTEAIRLSYIEPTRP